MNKTNTMDRKIISTNLIYLEKKKTQQHHFEIEQINHVPLSYQFICPVTGSCMRCVTLRFNMKATEKKVN